jgi:hypothetical protein
MNDTRRPFTRLGRPLTVLLAARALPGCGLMPDVTSIRNAAADARPGADPSLARGRIHIVVDGQDHVLAAPGRWCTAWSHWHTVRRWARAGACCRRLVQPLPTDPAEAA